MKEKKFTRRQLLFGTGVVALTAAVSQLPDVPFLSTPKPFSLTEKIEDVDPLFREFVSHKLKELAAHGRHIAHAMTFPLNTIMADNIARAIHLLNTTTPLAGSNSFIDIVDLKNTKNTYPTFPYAKLGPNPLAWADGICLCSTFFGRSILADPRYILAQATSHPQDIYGAAVARYQAQPSFSPAPTQAVKNLDIGVFYESPSILGGETSQVDLAFTYSDPTESGPMTFEIYNKNVPVSPSDHVSRGITRAQQVQQLPRSYYFLLAHSAQTLPENSIVHITNGILTRTVDGMEDVNLNLNPQPSST